MKNSVPQKGLPINCNDLKYFIDVPKYLRSRDSGGLRAGRSVVQVSWESFSSPPPPDRFFGPTQPPVQWVTGALSLGVKRQRREAIPPLPNTPTWCGVQLKLKDPLHNFLGGLKAVLGVYTFIKTLTRLFVLITTTSLINILQSCERTNAITERSTLSAFYERGSSLSK